MNMQRSRDSGFWDYIPITRIPCSCSCRAATPFRASLASDVHYHTGVGSLETSRGHTLTYCETGLIKTWKSWLGDFSHSLKSYSEWPSVNTPTRTSHAPIGVLNWRVIKRSNRLLGGSKSFNPEGVLINRYLSHPWNQNEKTCSAVFLTVWRMKWDARP